MNTKPDKTRTSMGWLIEEWDLAPGVKAIRHTDTVGRKGAYDVTYRLESDDENTPFRGVIACETFRLVLRLMGKPIDDFAEYKEMRSQGDSPKAIYRRLKSDGVDARMSEDLLAELFKLRKSAAAEIMNEVNENEST